MGIYSVLMVEKSTRGVSDVAADGSSWGEHMIILEHQHVVSVPDMVLLSIPSAWCVPLLAHWLKISTVGFSSPSGESASKKYEGKHE